MANRGVAPSRNCCMPPRGTSFAASTQKATKTAACIVSVQPIRSPTAFAVVASDCSLAAAWGSSAFNSGITVSQTSAFTSSTCGGVCSSAAGVSGASSEAGAGAAADGESAAGSALICKISAGAGSITSSATGASMAGASTCGSSSGMTTASDFGTGMLASQEKPVPAGREDSFPASASTIWASVAGDCSTLAFAGLDFVACCFTATGLAAGTFRGGVFAEGGGDLTAGAFPAGSFAVFVVAGGSFLEMGFAGGAFAADALAAGFFAGGADRDGFCCFTIGC